MNEDNFYSIDRLVEFGMSMAVAQQMVKTMNHAMVNMHTPGVMNSLQPMQPSIYFAMINGKQAGPLSEVEISRLISDNKVFKETYVWKPGMPNWVIAENVPELLKIVAMSPPPFDSNR
jgi:GYF domain 2